jgi:glycosyltransferase involved in cell wall biosynthesis
VDTDKILESVATMDVRSIYDDGHQSTDFVVLFVGALNVEKKVDVLINAFKQFVGDTRANAKLVIVGEGSDRNRLEALTAQGLKADIEFTGKVIEGVARYFLMADIFVLPGLGGLAVSEAMAYGVPVIASIGDGCEQDLLADGGGILDESLDELSLVGHLKSLYEDPKLRRLMADNAKATIINRYNTRSYLEGLIQAIKR